jgi:hypothetical protein
MAVAALPLAAFAPSLALTLARMAFARFEQNHRSWRYGGVTAELLQRLTTELNFLTSLSRQEGHDYAVISHLT